jgi:hypothetical protein
MQTDTLGADGIFQRALSEHLIYLPVPAFPNIRKAPVTGSATFPGKGFPRKSGHRGA